MLSKVQALADCRCVEHAAAAGVCILRKIWSALVLGPNGAACQSQVFESCPRSQESCPLIVRGVVMRVKVQRAYAADTDNLAPG